MRRRRARLRAEKWEKRRSRIYYRNQPSMENCIWAAGYFEGEGTVTLSPDGRGGARPSVSVTSVNHEVTDFFRDCWGGFISERIPKSKNGYARRAYTWVINAGEPIECFIEDLLFYIKAPAIRQKMELVLSDIRDRAPYQRCFMARSRSRKRMLLVRALNHRGTSPFFYFLSDDQTVGRWIHPQIARAYETGRMPSLLPAPEAKERPTRG